MISDFGLSKMEGTGDVMSTACGTPGYVGKVYIHYRQLLPLFAKMLFLGMGSEAQIIVGICAE